MQARVLTTYKVGCVSAETFMFKYFCFVHMLQIFKNGLDFGILLPISVNIPNKQVKENLYRSAYVFEMLECSNIMRSDS